MTLVLTTETGIAGGIVEVETANNHPFRARVGDFAAGEASRIGWDAATPNPLVLTVLPAGHPPGIYLLSSVVIVRTPSTGGITRSWQYSAPNFGPTQIVGFGAVTTTVAGHIPATFTGLAAASDGSAPITFTLLAAGIVGSPVMDVYAAATKAVLG